MIGQYITWFLAFLVLLYCIYLIRSMVRSELRSRKLRKCHFRIEAMIPRLDLTDQAISFRWSQLFIHLGQHDVDAANTVLDEVDELLAAKDEKVIDGSG